MRRHRFDCLEWESSAVMAPTRDTYCLDIGEDVPAELFDT
jgi:hypothetical protein